MCGEKRGREKEGEEKEKERIIYLGNGRLVSVGARDSSCVSDALPVVQLNSRTGEKREKERQSESLC